MPLQYVEMIATYKSHGMKEDMAKFPQNYLFKRAQQVLDEFIQHCQH